MSGPCIGSLCSGYGGLEMGVQAAIGGETAWVSDIDKGACKILAHRFPDVPNIGDMTAVDWSQVEPVDVLTGGTPCQDLSHAGKRAGMTEGTRSNLWVAMREAIAQLRPGLVVWENVRGAYSAPADSDLVNDPRLLAGTRRRDGQPVLRALGRVLGDLSELGYVGGWHGLRAADVGAPHGRFRVFVVAYPASDAGRFQHRDGATAPNAGRITQQVPNQRRKPAVQVPAGDGDQGRTRLTLLPTPEASRNGNTPESHLSRKPGRTRVTNLEVLAAGGLLPTPKASDGEWGTPSTSDRPREKSTHLSTRISLLPTTTATDARASGGNPTTTGTHGTALTDAAVRNPQDWGQHAAAIARWEALTRPAAPPTETGPKGNPRLSAAFSEWLMGLPAGWVTDVPGITRNEALKALGNGVVPQQAEAAVRFLLDVERAA